MRHKVRNTPIITLTALSSFGQAASGKRAKKVVKHIQSVKMIINAERNVTGKRFGSREIKKATIVQSPKIIAKGAL